MTLDTLNILVVSHVDDNFGDNLIRICFGSILSVVLKNLHLGGDRVAITYMALKEIDETLVKHADIIAFAGGGLFGLSYLNFFDSLDRITVLAAEHDIPVIFSSIGINNMDASPENEHKLQAILQRKCIKAVSVRENLHIFKQYAGQCDYEICKVCDPAVWTRYVYHKQLQNVPSHQGELVGINVVRGGLFNDNGKQWKLGDEIVYLNELKKKLDDHGIPYRFYTNGSVLDDNALHFYADQCDIPADHVIYPHTTRDLVQTVAQFDYVATVRMHSSIISYALSIPSVNLIWNDKIPFFYRNIGYPDRAVELAQWNGGHVFDLLQDIKDQSYTLDEEYLMSLYRYLYRVMNKLCQAGAKESDIFSFEEVKAALCNSSVSPDEDSLDRELKIEKCEKHYLSRFKEIKQNDADLKRQKKELDKATRALDKKTQEAQRLRSTLNKLSLLPSVFLLRAARKIYKTVVKQIQKAKA